LFKLFFKTVFTIAVLAAFAYFAWIYIIPKLSEHEQKKEKELFLVKRVIDGDTFELENKERVRMLGIDTPEKWESNKLERDVERTGQDKKTIQKLGSLASDYVKKLIEGKQVVLLPEPNYEDKDKYGRLLRYVYFEDGTFINKKIVEDGYANAYRSYKISKLDELIDSENKAREQHKGLWGQIDGLKQFDDPANVEKKDTDKVLPKNKTDKKRKKPAY
jgi:micrococcal nuclease